jgi:hypothetical protein
VGQPIGLLLGCQEGGEAVGIDAVTADGIETGDAGGSGHGGIGHGGIGHGGIGHGAPEPGGQASAPAPGRGAVEVCRNGTARAMAWNRTPGDRPIRASSLGRA